MKRLGTLSRVSQGKGLVTVEDAVPSINDTVVDETLTEIGTVVDLIGPTESPYAVIAPVEEIALVDLLNTRLYLRT